jgi:hypothetical protein
MILSSRFVSWKNGCEEEKQMGIELALRRFKLLKGLKEIPTTTFVLYLLPLALEVCPKTT